MDEIEKTEVELWTDFLNGHADAFPLLYKKLFQALYSYGVNLGMDDASIKDCIQDIFLKLYTKPGLITEPLTIRAFLFRSVKNHFLNILKKEQKFTESGIENIPFNLSYSIPDHLTDDKEEEALLKEKIDLLLSSLTSRQKEIIYFRFLYEMDYGEISEIMNISEQGARNLLYKTFEKIRKKYPEGLILLSVIQFN